MKTVLLLTLSNTFMNLAWYGHLKFKDQPLWIVIFVSWGIALFEYIFRSGQPPRFGRMQECITLVVFSVVAFLLFRSPIKWNIGVSYVFIVGAVYFAFKF